MASVTITGVTKSFGDVQVLQEFSQKFEDGEFITLLVLQVVEKLQC